jgi:hypothetical protein
MIIFSDNIAMFFLDGFRFFSVLLVSALCFVVFFLRKFLPRSGFLSSIGQND